MSFTYCSIDIESCGISDICDIIEFAAVLDDLSQLKPIDELPVFHTYFVKDNYLREPVALSMHPEIFRRISERDRNKYNFSVATKIGYSFKRFLIQNGYEEDHDKVTITVAGKNFASLPRAFLNISLRDFSASPYSKFGCPLSASTNPPELRYFLSTAISFIVSSKALSALT